jgi:uncharacterized membrane protein YgcG
LWLHPGMQHRLCRWAQCTRRAATSLHQVYISTGAGALNHLPDNKVEAILARMRPPLRAAEYDEAVEQAVVDIGLGLAGQGAPVHHTQLKIGLRCSIGR